MHSAKLFNIVLLIVVVKGTNKDIIIWREMPGFAHHLDRTDHTMDHIETQDEQKTMMKNLCDTKK